MKVEDSKYKFLKHKKVITSFGNFYFFDKFIVSEINEGIHFGWKQVSILLDDAYNYYGENFKVVYISNRINSYSMEPQTWIRLKKEGHNFVLAAVLIIYDEISLEVATLEKRFFNRSMKRCFSLEEAVNWTNNLREFKQKR